MTTRQKTGPGDSEMIRLSKKRNALMVVSLTLFLASCDGDSSSGTSGPAYVGTWHILKATLLAGGAAGAPVMDISAQNSQLVISTNQWVAKDNDPTSGCDSVKLSLSVSGGAWTSTILSKVGACPSYTGPNYAGTWSVSNDKLTWTMNNLVSWTAERM